MAVITLSDSRTAAEDRSGQAVVDALQSVGHTVVSRHLLTDDAEPLRQLLERLRDDESVEAIITTGGTGVAKRDLAIDVIESMLDVTLPGFGETFRRVSFDEIGPKAMLSRATAGRLGDTMVFALPGSTGGVRTAMTQCVLPILVHAVRLAQR
ncbi:MAG: MogA/MoaB family molybdenum cofactor biosynthesis protein [Planctomycetota bacterium]